MITVPVRDSYAGLDSCAAHFELTNVEALFLDSHGVQNCLKAIAWTYMSGFSAMFFYRQASFSRLLLSLSAMILLGGILLLRLGFRHLVKHSSKQVERLRVIMIGADEFRAADLSKTVRQRSDTL